ELDRVLQRLMEPGSPVRRLFGGIPFEAPPSRMRVRLYVLAPAATREPRASGRYWHRDLVGDMLPPRGADPALFDRWLPDPAQSGRDRRSAKGRARRLAPLLDARSLADVQRFVDADAAALWAAFWTDVMPAAAAAADSGWEAVDALARELDRTMG